MYSILNTIQLNLVPRLRVRGDIPPLTRISPWRGSQLSTGYVFTTWYLVKYRDNFLLQCFDDFKYASLVSLNSSLCSLARLYRYAYPSFGFDYFLPYVASFTVAVLTCDTPCDSFSVKWITIYNQRNQPLNLGCSFIYCFVLLFLRKWTA
jgi:hypothetical protein